MRDIYGEEVVYERHRHRYELNNRYRQTLEEHGMRCSGTSPDGLLVEFIELPSTHPFFVATQAHPEFKSRPNRPHPLFAAFRRSRASAGRRPRPAPADRHGRLGRVASRRSRRRSLEEQLSELDALLTEHDDWLAVERGLAANSLAAYRRDLRRYAAFLATRELSRSGRDR